MCGVFVGSVTVTNDLQQLAGIKHRYLLNKK